jgi:uncharacterized membrane protein
MIYLHTNKNAKLEIFLWAFKWKMFGTFYGHLEYFTVFMVILYILHVLIYYIYQEKSGIPVGKLN